MVDSVLMDAKKHHFIQTKIDDVVIVVINLPLALLYSLSYLVKKELVFMSPI